MSKSDPKETIPSQLEGDDWNAEVAQEEDVKYALSLDLESLITLKRDEARYYADILKVRYNDQASTLDIIKLLHKEITTRTQASTQGQKGKLPLSGDQGQVEVMQRLMQMAQSIDNLARQQAEAAKQQSETVKQLADFQRRGGRANTHASGGAGNVRNNDDENVADDGADQEENQNRNEVKVQVRPPRVIEDGIKIRAFKKWEMSWNNYAAITGLNKKPNSSKLSTFWSYCSDNFLNRIIYAIGIPQDTTDALETVIEKIRSYLKDQRSVVVDRYDLMRKRQDDGEDFDDFLVKLRELAEDAGFHKT